MDAQQLRADALEAALGQGLSLADAMLVAARMVHLVEEISAPPALVEPPANDARITSFPPPWFRPPVLITKET